MLEEELNMVLLDVIDESGSDSTLFRRRETIFFISQPVIILSNSDIHSFHKSGNIKASNFRDFDIEPDRTNGRPCTLMKLFIGSEKLMRANRVCLLVANIVRDVSRVSWIVFRFFLLRARRTVISTAESS